MSKRKIAVLMTCHNRVAKTLECLGYAYRSMEKCPYAEFKVHLVDDGSTDGTADRVREIHPEVNVIPGSGNLYWAGGMRLAWTTAATEQDPDAYIWLNDDSNLRPEAFDMLLRADQLAEGRAVVCGSFVSAVTGKITYGGRLDSPEFLAPDGTLQKCETISGNFVLVPRSVFQAIGGLDKVFRHAIADFDYGRRAIATGFRCVVAPEIAGTCESNPRLPRWCLPEVPVIQRFRNLYSPLAYAQPLPFFVYERRHFGLALALRHFLSIHLRAAFPRLWKKE